MPRPSNNPYAHFLGMPESVTQPDHYELLGIEKFTADPGLIKAAAAKRNRQLHKWQTNDEHYQLARQLQMEVATAMMVLVDPQKREAYNQAMQPTVEILNDPTEISIPHQPTPPRPQSPRENVPGRQTLPVRESGSLWSNLPFLATVVLSTIIGVSLLGFTIYRSVLRSQSDQVAQDDTASSNRENKERRSRKTAAKTVAPEPEPMNVEAKTDSELKIAPTWDRELAKLNGFLPLPARSLNLYAFAPPKVVDLTEIPEADPKDIDLILHSPNGSSKTLAEKEQEGFVLQTVDIEESDGQSRRKWIVRRQLINQLTLSGRKTYQIGSFELSGESLSFAWETNQRKGSKYQCLPYSLLEIRHKGSGVSHKFRLSNPKKVPALPYDLSQRVQNLFLATKSGVIENPNNVFLDLTIYVKGKPVGSRRQLRVEETATLRLPQNDVELELTFQYDDYKGPYLEAKAFSKLRMVVDGNAKSQASPRNPIGQIVGLQRLREDIDRLVIEDRRVNVSPTDLVRISRMADITKRLLESAVALKEHKKIEKDLSTAISRENDPKRRADLESRRGKRQKEIEKYNGKIQVVADWIPWAKNLKPYLDELAKSTQVSYAIYTVIDGGKVYLARNEMADSSDGVASGKSEPIPLPKPGPLNAPFDVGTAQASQQAWAKFLGKRIVETNSNQMKMVLIPPGTFRMGAPDTDSMAYRNEKPQQSVTLTQPFLIGQMEVTQGQWQAVMGTTPWKSKAYIKEGPNFPATNMSWNDAMSFCRKLTLRDRQAGGLLPGWTYTLPTEAQWEYACRAGTTTKFSFGDSESDLGNYAWYHENAWSQNEKYSHEVGQKLGNSFRLFDMHGNVCEWCRDVYTSPLPGGTDPEVTSGGLKHVYRGACWYYIDIACRSSYREEGPIYLFSPSLQGFRVVAVPPRK